jgi:hypothetical protein
MMAKPSFAPTHRPQPPPSYEWEMLNGMLGFGGVEPLIPVCPSVFKDVGELDVFMVDVVAFQTGIDSVTGEPVDSRTDPELTTTVAGCVCEGGTRVVAGSGLTGYVCATKEASRSLGRNLFPLRGSSCHSPKQRVQWNNGNSGASCSHPTAGA